MTPVISLEVKRSIRIAESKRTYMSAETSTRTVRLKMKTSRKKDHFDSIFHRVHRDKRRNEEL